MKLRLACTLVVLMQSAFVTAAQDKTEYSIDDAKSKLEINVYKEGLFKAFGHDHLIAAREVSGSVQFDAQRVENSSVRLKFGAKSLTAVDPGESEKDRRDVQATMTGEKVLNIAKFPEIVFSSAGVSAVKKTADGWDLTVSGKLDLHGVEKPVSVPLHLHVEGSQLAAQGEVSLLQTEYGITPVNIAGGSVKVKDKLRISFAIVATKASPQ
jgi:polyisoprenoid-binding protein YceI